MTWALSIFSLVTISSGVTISSVGVNATDVRQRMYHSGSGTQISEIDHHQQQGCGKYASDDEESDIGLAVSCLAHGTYAQADSTYDGKRTQERDEPKYFGKAKCRIKEFCIAGVAAMSALSSKTGKDDDADHDDGRNDQEEHENRY